MSTPYRRRTATGIELDLHVVPGAKRSGFQGLHGDRINLAVSAPPADGKANEAVIKAIAELLDLPKGSITIIRGLKNRTKTVAIDGFPSEAAWLKHGL